MLFSRDFCCRNYALTNPLLPLPTRYAAQGLCSCRASVHLSVCYKKLAFVVKYFPAEKTAGELSSCESFLRCSALIVSFLCILSYPLRRFPGGPVTHAAWCVCLGQWHNNGVGRVHKVHGAPSSRQKITIFPLL